MRNFFCQSIPGNGQSAELDANESRHAQTVLRVRVGDLVGLLDGEGVAATAEITGIGGRRDPVVYTVLERRELDPPTPAIHLHIAPSRTKGMNAVIRQATEMGIASVTPVITERSVSKPDDQTLGAWRNQAVEACNQSGNPFLPELHPPTPLAVALASAVPGYYGAVPEDTGNGPDHQTPLTSHQALALFIGPEGGFTDDEIALLNSRLQPLCVGPYILRVETAVTGCISVICALRGTGSPGVDE
jgi:16S rRNA (uracil1498-N3)-methyltransferase